MKTFFKNYPVIAWGVVAIAAFLIIRAIYKNYKKSDTDTGGQQRTGGVLTIPPSFSGTSPSGGGTGGSGGGGTTGGGTGNLGGGAKPTAGARTASSHR